MSKPVRPRRWLALFAAYVVALQALLLPLTVAAGPSFDGLLCSATSADAGHRPASGDTGCACAAGCGMQCCAQALAGPPHVALTRLVAGFTTVAAHKPADAAIRTADRSPQRARAPPAA